MKNAAGTTIGSVRVTAAIVVLIAGVQTSRVVSADAEVSLDFTAKPLYEVFDTIGAAGDLQIRYDDRVDPNEAASVYLSASVDDALRLFARANQLFVVESGPQEILIAPDSWQMREKYTPRRERTFHLDNADPRTVVTVLRSILQVRDLDIDEERRTVTMEDTDAQLELAAVLIERIDRPAGDGAGTTADDGEPLWVGYGYDPGWAGDTVPRLEIDMGQPLVFDANPATAGQFFDAVGEATGVQFLFDRKVDVGQALSMDLAGTRADEAVSRVNDSLGWSTVVWGPRTVYIGPDVSSRRQAVEPYVARLFYLTDADTRSVITALRRELQVRQVAEIPRLNAVVLRDSAATVEAAAVLVDALEQTASSASESEAPPAQAAAVAR